MRIKISKVAKDLNVGVNTVVEFLRKQGIDVENNPNARIDESAEKMLKSEFSSDIDDKKRVDDFTTGRQKPKKGGAERYDASSGTSVPQAPGLKVLGKIDLDAQRRGGSRHGNNQSKHNLPRKPRNRKSQNGKRWNRNKKSPRKRLSRRQNSQKAVCSGLVPLRHRLN